jgi:hypothetical protein
MCRNHSHIACEITGHLRVGATDLLEVRMRTPLEMQLPYGEKLIKSNTTALWVPVSPRVPLPPSTPVQMEVCYTPLYYTVASDMTTMHATPTRPSPYGATGRTVSNTMATSQAEVSDEQARDDDVPW